MNRWATNEGHKLLIQIMRNCLYRAREWEDYFYIGINMRRRYRREGKTWK